MITDKIKFPPKYAQEDSATFASASVDVEGLTPERVWRNLCNISIWGRVNPTIVDIQPIDSGDNDPHLFDKMQFNYDLTNGQKVAAQVICLTPPKDDRTGRLAYQGTVLDNGKEVNEFVAEFIVGVPGFKGEFPIEAAVSYKNNITQEEVEANADTLDQMLVGIAHWSVKHH